MFYKQKSCFPVIISAIAFLIILCFISFWIYAFSVAYVQGLWQHVQWEGITIGWFFSRIFPVALFPLAIIFLNLIVVSMFPSISLTESGISYKSALTNGKIRWDEIIHFSQLKWIQGYSIVVICRKGTTLIRPNGLLLNIVHGTWLGVFEPILLLSDRLENYKEIAGRIQEELGKRSSQTFE